ncbi:hypothetical protein CXB37_08775 [Pseudomonas syringae pv. syringae]|nr:hypothetical protein CXB37_08775 [Pseudomonas syringae pv. syringae]
MRLAWRPARLPPDQCQDSAVTYVALCVVRAIVVEKHFCGSGCGLDYRCARSSVGMPVLTLRVKHLRGSVKIKTGPRPLPLKKPENPC